MNKKLFFFCLGAVGVALGIGVVFFSSHQSKEKTASTESHVPALVATITQPTITIKDIILKEHGKDKHYELMVKAKESTVHHVTDSIECKNVACNITHQGKPIAHLSAEKSFVDRQGKNVIFAGPVKGSFKDISMQGRDINYNFSQQIITTDQQTTYTHASFNLSAQQSVVDIKKQKIILKNGVRSEFLSRPAANEGAD